MIYCVATLSLLLVAPAAVNAGTSMENLLNRKFNDPDRMAKDISRSEFAAVFDRTVAPKKRTVQASDSLPLVFLHGMGDSCFNTGMKSITEESGEYLGVYSTCIPTGDDKREDTLNGFFMDMDTSVDVFAEKVRADAQLAGGFNCVGLSQGNNICRGYIQKYNDPPVNTHLSIHGPVVGVAALPHCYPDGNYGDLCEEISNVLADIAYTQPMQDFLFQADYFRDVNYVNTEEYKKYSQMAEWNQEGDTTDTAIKTNFAKTNTFAMIKANEDSVVVPREGEWWGAFDTDFETILTMKETAWYKDDTFGLRTADEAGKIFFNSTQGNHLDFSDEELYGWLDDYC